MIRNYATLATHTRNGYEWKLITDNKDGTMSLVIEYANGEAVAEEWFDLDGDDVERLKDLFTVASKAVN